MAFNSVLALALAFIFLSNNMGEINGLNCYWQQPGWRFWKSAECETGLFCMRLKNCNKTLTLEKEVNRHISLIRMHVCDEVRDCVRHNFCEKIDPSCDCKLCATDKCNSAFGLSRKIPFAREGIIVLCLAMATSIWGIIGGIRI